MLAELEHGCVVHEVSHLLLYAKTDKDIQHDGIYQISAKTLDPSQPFDTIRIKLDAISEAHFAKDTVAI